MDLALTPEQVLIRDTIRAFARKHVEPHAREWDRTQTFPLETLRALGPLGFLGALVPPEYGGVGLDKVSYLLGLEELAYADAGFSVGVAVHTSVAALPIVWFGTADQKKRFLPRLATGESLGAFAVTEPGAGSDVNDLQTKADRVGNEYVLNGSKQFITNGSHADLLIVAARTRPADGHQGLSLFVVEADGPGVERGGHEEKLGLRSSDTARLAFRDLRVPADCRLGAEGDGFRQLMRILNSSRLSIGAQSVGIARRALDESLRYAKERKQFGVPIAQHQAIQFALADLETQIEAARLLTYKAAADEDRGQLRPEAASMAKLLASRVANRAARQGVQIHGGNGYLRDFVVERLMRDAPVTEIYEGTTEVQRLIIGRTLLRS